MDCISKINNALVDNAKDLDIVLMYNLIEYNNNYSKTSGCLWQYYRDKPNVVIIDFESFKSKVRITGSIPAAGNTKDFEIAVPLQYLNNFCKSPGMPLINCKINLILTWYAYYVIPAVNGAKNLNQCNQENF